MKPTQVAELFANIKNTFVSFFSILMFVALGVGIYLGISWAGPALQVAADKTFDEGVYHDFQVQFSYGLTGDDLAKLADVEGVTQVEAGRQSFQTLPLDSGDITVKVQTMGKDVNALTVIEGELPADKDELAMNAYAARKLDVAVGDTVMFESDSDDEAKDSGDDESADSTDKDGMQYLNGATYKVTALVNSPDYLANSSATYGYSNTPSGSVDMVAFVLPEAFDGEAFQDGYPIANVRCDGLRGPGSFSDEYEQKASVIKERIVKLGGTLSQARYDDMRGDAQDKLDDAKQQLEDGRKNLEDAEAQLDQARSNLDQQRAMLAMMPGGDQMIADSEQQIADGEADLEKARTDVADAEAEVADNQDKIDQMKKHDWAVSTRDESFGAVEIDTFSGVTNRLSFSMAALFVIVGLLVSYSAVSRIVHEQITQIGTKKALGLREREITLSFLAYSALAVISGAIIGTIVGVTLVEGIIGHVLGGMFIMGDYPPYFGLALFLVVSALELVLVLGATWFACHSILREHAVELLKGEKPPEGKTRFYEKWAIWDRLPLFTQTIVNNCMNDHRRVFSTIVGVAGCTALIVTAITLNNDVLKSYDRHYDDVYGFDIIAYVDPDVENADEKVEAAVEDAGAAAAQVLRKTFAMTQPNGGRGSIHLIVPADPDEFSELYHINPVEGPAFDPAADGAWVSQAYASKMGAHVGDSIAVEGGDGTTHDVPIMGFYEFWLTSHEMVMGRDYYEREFDTDLVTSALLVDSKGMSTDDVEAAVSGVDGYYSLVDDKANQHSNFGEFSSVSSAVVAIYLVLAALMAVVVLLNLNVMFIDEKKRELIVLMINGFSVKDAKRYIYNDTIVLTAIGIVCGIILGCVSGAITVGSVEPSTAQFIKDVDPMAVVAGIVGSAVLAFIMSAIALRRIPRFALTDINKQ